MPTAEPQYPGAVAPERSRFLESNGARLHLQEWGDPEAQPVVLAHGMFDHGRSFDPIAGALSEHFRLIAVDARGHGDSSWCDAYVWRLDVLDICNVVADLGRPAHLVGHSKGGGQVTDAAAIAPDRVLKLVNIDGFGPPEDGGFARPGQPEFHLMSFAERARVYLDRRQRAAAREQWSAYPELDDLAARRAEQNPRLSMEWLRYFAFHGAREHDDGWRWKVDPQCAAGGFGPFKVEWVPLVWRRLESPMLAIIGSEQDTWGPLPESVLAPRLANVRQLERATIAGAGHFTHIEQPAATAQCILDFLDP